MKKYFKKISALLMAAIMVLSMCTAVFAAGETTSVPKDDDKAKVTISGLEDGVNIKAYQIVDGDYGKNGKGFIGFKWTGLSGKTGDVFTNDGKGNDILNLSQTDLTTIVGNINDSTTYKEFQLDSDNKSKEALEVGTWLLLVSGGKKVYNPMVVSVYYATVDGTVTGGLLNASDKKWDLVGGVAYAKETDITIDKVADKDTAAHDEVVNFTITGVIPSYSSQYTTDVTYKITDTLTNLKLNGDPVVKLAGTPVDATNYNYKPTETGFEISFDSNYIKGLANQTDVQRTVTVTYSATVKAEATTWNPAKNEAHVEYTNNPDGSTTSKETETKTYTFDIDGQILKVGEDGTTPLPGATFTLYKAYDTTNKTVSDEIASYQTLTEGKIIFKGLVAGTYYLKETEAPASYTLNTTIYEITITPNYTEATKNNKEGKKELESYSVTVKEAGSTDAGETGNYTKDTTTISELIKIQNTKVGQLPSTGGMGTYIFTIAGVVLMACAAGAFIISRKKSSEE